VFQCLEGSIDAYIDKCLDNITYFAEFQIRHISRHENSKANMLPQQALGFDVRECNFHIEEKLMQKEESKPNRAKICSNKLGADLGDWRTPIINYL
jgi:hypothetical protein